MTEGALTADRLDRWAKSNDRLALWADVINETGARTIAEVGVWKGDFAAHVLAECPQIERYYMIDPWASLPDWNKPANVSPERFDAIYDEAMAKTSFAADKLTVLRGRTMEVVDQIPNGALDLAYVDGDHTLRGITLDLTAMLPKVRPGGLLTGDDFSRSPWQHNEAFEPTLVCPYAIYFAEAHRSPIAALPKAQFIIDTTPGQEFSFTDTTGKYDDLSLTKLHQSRVPENKRAQQ